MLHDRPRAAAYAAALAKVVRPGALVLDIGAGTGLLSALALRAAPDVTVVACEQWAPMAALARRVLGDNGCEKVEVVPSRSDDPPLAAVMAGRRADVIVSEILDSCLLGEGALPTMAHAGAHLLKQGGVAVPSAGRLLACVVASPVLRARWVSNACATLRPLHVGALAGAAGLLVPLTPPAVVASFDLTRPRLADLSGETTTSLPPATAAGPADAVVAWWEVDLAPGVALSTAPAWAREAGDPPPPPWTDHWKQAWAPGAAGVAVAVGDAVALRVRWDSTEVSMSLAAAPPPPPADLYCPDGDWLWGLSAGGAAALDAGARAVAAAAAGGAVLALGDGHLAALAAARAGADVVALVDSPGAARATARAAAAASVPVRVELLTVALQRTTDASPAAIALLAEPHYADTEGLPWDCLRFWRAKDALVAAGALAPTATLSPSSARLVLVGLHAPDLYRTRGALGSVQGVDMGVLDAAARAGASPNALLPRAAWQCGATRDATTRETVYELDFLGEAGEIEGDAVLRALDDTPTRIHAVAAWLALDAAPGARHACAPDPGGGPAPGPHAVLVLRGEAAAPLRVRARLSWGPDGRPRGTLEVV
jgi:SAM-dependent methyltransferase